MHYNYHPRVKLPRQVKLLTKISLIHSLVSKENKCAAQQAGKLKETNKKKSEKEKNKNLLKNLIIGPEIANRAPCKVVNLVMNRMLSQRNEMRKQYIR
jgi:hypothetical protein